MGNPRSPSRRAFTAQLAALLAAAPSLAQVATVLRAPRRRSALPTWPALPPAAWNRMEPVALPGTPVTPCLGTADGGCVVGTGAPPGVVFVGADGSIVASSRIDDRAEQPLASGLDGRVYAVTRAASVLTLAPDATVREVAHLPAAALSTPAVLDDGTVVVFAASVRGGSAHLLAATGERSATVNLRVAVLGHPVAWGGRAVAATATGLVTVDPAGAVARLPVVPGILSIAALRDGCLALGGTEGLARLDARGRVLATLATPTVEWVAPTDGDALWAQHAGPSPRLTCHGPDLAERWSLPLPSTAHPPGVDERGAGLLCCRDGTVIAVEPDGTERWRLTVGEPLLGAAVRLAGGRFAVAAVRSGLLLLHGAT